MGWSAKPDLIHLKKPNQCGSWLACDGSVGFTTAIAGKPAPTFGQFPPLLWGVAYTTNDSNMMKISATIDRMVSIAVQVLNVSATVMLKYCLTSQNPASLT